MEDENRRTVQLLIDLFVNIKNELVSTNVNKTKYNYMHIATYLFILTPLLPIIVVAAAACHRRCQPADPHHNKNRPSGGIDDIQIVPQP